MSASALPTAARAVRRPRRRLRFARDEELVRLVRAGDACAFEAIYDRHHRGILAFSRHMLGSLEEAEDAVQHTFIAAHRDLSTSDKPIQLKAWLYTIARNRCLSFLRARRDERALDEVAEPSVEGLASQVQRRQDLRDMVADLQKLPEDQRAALVLSEIGALSHDEVAVALDVRKDKVKALVFQARESLASTRQARDADCREIQEQLAVLRGGSLRRTTLRRHVEVCPACAAFKAEVQRQRSAMALILPVVPSLALKESVIAAVAGVGGGMAGGGGAITSGGLLAAAGSKALAAKVMTIAVVAGGATGGGLMAVDEISQGGDGGTATAMAPVPEERESVRMVGALRERAKSVAAERSADRAAASAAAPAGRERPAPRRSTPVASVPERARAQRRRRSAASRRRPAPAPIATVRAEAPAPAPAPQPAAPAPVVDRDERRGPPAHADGPKTDRPVKTDRGRGPKLPGADRKGPSVPAAGQGVGHGVDDERHGGKHEKWGGERRRKVEKAIPPTPALSGRGKKDKGAAVEGHGRGNGPGGPDPDDAGERGGHKGRAYAAAADVVSPTIP